MREWHIPEHWNLQQPCHENIKSHKNDQHSYWCNMCNMCCQYSRRYSTQYNLLAPWVFFTDSLPSWNCCKMGSSPFRSFMWAIYNQTKFWLDLHNFTQIHSQLSLHYVLSGAFTKPEWRASVSCAITSASPPSRLHRTTLPPVGRFLLHFILVIFGKIWEENSNLIKIRQNCHFTWRQMNIYVYAG